jgi:hypothetical protein
LIHSRASIYPIAFVVAAAASHRAPWIKPRIFLNLKVAEQTLYQAAFDNSFATFQELMWTKDLRIDRRFNRRWGRD